MQPDAVPASEIVPILCGIINPNAIPIYRGGAADAPGVGRARANHGMSSQRMIQPRDYCGPTANACESGIRALSQATHPLLGQVIAGNARERHSNGTHPAAIAWERNRGQRPRAPSQGTHPTVIAPNCAEKERPRASCQAAPAGANTAGRLSRAVGVVPPNQRMQSDAASRPQDRADFTRQNLLQ
ncbi:MAG: hypothetical protein IPP13_03345 [Kouleothrix sp.]|jgi:hypothetical protein|nr:hypothetical protein [Kouleothrix sp.]